MSTATPTAPELVVTLEAKIDALSEQVAFLTAEARLAQQRREGWADLGHDVMPIAGGMLTVLERELSELSADVELADLTDLLRRFVRVAPYLDAALGYLEMFADLAADVTPMTGQVMDAATGRLAELDGKGYFGFARAGMRVVDRVVTSFDENDIEALGDNVVLILDTVKELTQPDIMAVLHQMIEAVHRQQAAMAAEPAAAPSLFQLLTRLRDPAIRTGLGRALNTLGAVSAVDPSGTTHPSH